MSLTREQQEHLDELARLERQRQDADRKEAVRRANPYGEYVKIRGGKTIFRTPEGLFFNNRGEAVNRDGTVKRKRKAAKRKAPKQKHVAKGRHRTAKRRARKR